MYTLRLFQWYKEHFNVRCFDPCSRALNFQKSRRTTKSHFRECEWRPHTSLKVGLRQLICGTWFSKKSICLSFFWTPSSLPKGRQSCQNTTMLCNECTHTFLYVFGHYVENICWVCCWYWYQNLGDHETLIDDIESRAGLGRRGVDSEGEYMGSVAHDEVAKFSHNN